MGSLLRLTLLAIYLVAVLPLAGCYTSKATLAEDHETKKWVVTHPSDIDSENSKLKIAGLSGATVPFWSKQKPTYLAGDAENDNYVSGVNNESTNKGNFVGSNLHLALKSHSLTDPYPVAPVLEVDILETADENSNDQKHIAFETHIGNARIVDGNTIDLSGEHIRLLGINSPDLHQVCLLEENMSFPCGEDSKNFLSDLILDRALTCRGQKRDRNNNLIARCFIGEQDIGRKMVLEGKAFSKRKPIDYLKDEKRAREGKRGMWQWDSFDLINMADGS
tara:strand:- start:333 stop:1166 length:834 start_codon:yes stop_codon:yes gene_type:complete